MRWVRSVIALVLALLWVPVTAHCEWANLPGWEAFRCESPVRESVDSEAHSSGHGTPHGHARDTGCCSVESSAYLASVARDETAAPLQALDLETLPPDSGWSVLSVGWTRTEPPVAPPPEIPPWQFRFRAARPPRAPSSAF